MRSDQWRGELRRALGRTMCHVRSVENDALGLVEREPAGGDASHECAVNFRGFLIPKFTRRRFGLLDPTLGPSPRWSLRVVRCVAMTTVIQSYIRESGVLNKCLLSELTSQLVLWILPSQTAATKQVGRCWQAAEGRNLGSFRFWISWIGLNRELIGLDDWRGCNGPVS